MWVKRDFVQCAMFEVTRGNMSGPGVFAGNNLRSSKVIDPKLKKKVFEFGIANILGNRSAVKKRMIDSYFFCPELEVVYHDLTTFDNHFFSKRGIGTARQAKQDSFFL